MARLRVNGMLPAGAQQECVAVVISVVSGDGALDTVTEDWHNIYKVRTTVNLL
jgi:hypothetical protein